MKTDREEVSGAHGEELDEGLHGEDGGEEVVAVQQKRVEKRRPEKEEKKVYFFAFSKNPVWLSVP